MTTTNSESSSRGGGRRRSRGRRRGSSEGGSTAPQNPTSSTASDERRVRTPESDAYAAELAAEVDADNGFVKLGVAPELAGVLARKGITEPFEIQVMTIPECLTGKDLCGKAKTGSGKTLAFGLPMLQRLEPARPRHPRGLILAPTRELARQVTKELEPLAEARGLRITTVYGGAPLDKQAQLLREGVDIVVATPGRLIDFMQRRDVSVSEVECVVLDEADQMADMGFLPQVNKILPKVKREHQTMLFSATLDGAVGELVHRYMKDPLRHEVESETVTVDTMKHRFIMVHPMNRVAVAGRIAEKYDRVLMFVQTKRACDEVAGYLGKLEIDAQAIHGDLPQNVREKALKKFSDGELRVLVATNVAARGIHVEGVDVVVNFDPPEDEKTYLHRAGRTARAGKDGLVVTFALIEQFGTLKATMDTIGLDHAIEPMLPEDPRLEDIAAWEPESAKDRKAARDTKPRGRSIRGRRGLRRR